MPRSDKAKMSSSRPILTIAPCASVGSNFVPHLEALSRLCHHAHLGHYPEGRLHDANFHRVKQFLDKAYTTVLHEWRALHMDPGLGDKIDTLVPWPRHGHTDLLSLARAVADQVEATHGPNAFLCTALVCPIFTATQSAIFLLFADELHKSLVNCNPDSHQHQGLVAGYCGGAGLAIVLSCASDMDDLVALSLENVRIGFWLGLASDRAAARARQGAGVPSLIAQLQSWALVTMNIELSILEEEIELVNRHVPKMQQAYISAHSPHEQYTIMGFPTTLTFIETTLRRRIKADKSRPTRALGRVARIPIYGPFHSEELLACEHQNVRKAVQRRHIFAHTPLATKEVEDLRHETLAQLYSATNGAIHMVKGGAAPALIDMILCTPNRWDKVVDSLTDGVRRFTAKHPTAIVRVLNIGPGASLGQSLVDHLQKVQLGAVLVDLEEQILTAAKSVAQTSLPPLDSIAIVSSAIRAPGGVYCSQTFWDRLQQGSMKPTKLPLQRFRIDDYTPEARQEGARTIHNGATWGHYLSDIDKFDARLFSISPREAERLDPHHRFLLECAMEAMERAGYAPGAQDSLNTDRIATFFAVANDDYRDNGCVDIRSFHLTGNGRAFAAGRVSFLNKWKGPSATIDSGEMSVLAALMAATDALRSYKCDTAIVAGANLVLSPTTGIALDQAGILAHTGEDPSAPLSAQVRGTVRGETCGAIVLKRMETALIENDDIQALLTGIAATFSPVGWISPYNEEASPQEKERDRIKQVTARSDTLRKALKRAELNVEALCAVECNCSGNATDEQSEIEALAHVLQDKKQPCFLSTAKSVFGDAESASGILSLIKAVEMARRNKVPPHRPLKEPNQALRIHEACLALNEGAEPVPLHRSESIHQRTGVAVQSFSVAGGNAVAIVERADSITSLRGKRPALSRQNEPCQIVLLISANTKSALATRIIDLATWLKENPTANLIDLTYSLACRKIQYPLRIAIPIKTAEEAGGLLTNFTDLPASAPQPADVVIFFSGQGSQYSGMARILLATSRLFEEKLVQADAYLRERGFPTFLDTIRSGGILDDEATQSAIFCVDYALYTLLRRFGVQPGALAGHSLGEYCALACAGVLQFEDALYLVASRARLVVKHCNSGSFGMLAVRAGAKQCSEVISSTQSSCEIACDNAEEAVTIAGDTQSLSTIQKALEGRNIKATKFGVNFAFHSKSMDAITSAFLEIAQTIRFNAPEVAIYSNVKGCVVPAGTTGIFDAEYLVKHARHVVHFREAITHAQDLRTSEASKNQRRKGLPPQIAIEAGADAIILPMLRNVRSKDGKNQAFSQTSSCLNRRQHDVECLLNTLGRLWTAHVPIDWRVVYSDCFPDASFTPTLPTYPFDDTRFYTPFTDRGLIKLDEAVYVTDPSEATVDVSAHDQVQSSAIKSQAANGFLEMMSFTHNEQGAMATFRVVQEHYFIALARNHCVGETALTPGTLTGVVCQQAAFQTLSTMGFEQEAGSLFCRAMHLPGPLPMPEQPDRDIHVQCTVVPKNEGSNKSKRHLVSCALTSEKGAVGATSKTTALHNEITFETGHEHDTAREFSLLESLLLPSLLKAQQETECEILERAMAYQLFGRCVIYGEPYHAMRSIRMKVDLGVARVELGRGRDMLGYRTVPRLPDSLTIDAIGQLPGLMLNLLSDELDDDHVFILDSCGRTVFLPRLKQLEEKNAEVFVLGTSRIEPHNDDAKGDVFALADTFTFEQTSQGPKLVAIMLGSRYHKMRTRTLLSVLRTVA